MKNKDLSEEELKRVWDEKEEVIRIISLPLKNEFDDFMTLSVTIALEELYVGTLVHSGVPLRGAIKSLRECYKKVSADVLVCEQCKEKKEINYESK